MGLERKKPLRRDTPGAKRFAAQRSELARTPMKRSQSPAAGTPRRKVPQAPDPIAPATRRALRDRSGGACEVRASTACRGAAGHVHHRKLRRHGDHRLENLLDVCLVCHDAIHANVAAATAAGMLVPSTDDPAAVPVRTGPLRPVQGGGTVTG